MRYRRFYYALGSQKLKLSIYYKDKFRKEAVTHHWS